MDAVVAQAMAKWPNVPAVFGWLSLDRRGNWLVKGERISNRAMREFRGRNCEPDAQGGWFFQNGPQRVFVSLAYAPLVLHYEGDALFDHCGRPFAASAKYLDEEGSLLMSGSGTIGLLDDRDLARHVDEADALPVLQRDEIPGRFGFVRNP